MAESHSTRRLFGAKLQQIELLLSPAGRRAVDKVELPCQERRREEERGEIQSKDEPFLAWAFSGVLKPALLVATGPSEGRRPVRPLLFETARGMFPLNWEVIM
jgi:hypothetical protein